MALSGSFRVKAFHYIDVVVNWEVLSESADDNISVIKWNAYSQNTYNNGWVYQDYVKIYINNKLVVSSGGYNDWGQPLGSGQMTIEHELDGSKTVPIRVDSMYYGGYYADETEEISLTRFPRASKPSCITYPDSTDAIGDIGTSIRIYTNSMSARFTHTVTYSFGDASGTIGTNVADSILWTIPLSLCEQIPNAISGSGIITVITYDGEELIGTETCPFTCSVPSSIVPTLDDFNYSLDNSANSVISEWGIAVAGYTKVNLTASASGAGGSSVAGYNISGLYNASTTGDVLNYTGSILLSSGDKTVYVSCRDSRGRLSNQQSNTITVYPYTNPSITLFTVNRNSENQKEIAVRCSWSISSVNNNNTSSAIIKYKKKTESTWSIYGSINNNSSVTISNLEETNSYDFQLVVTDAIGNASSSSAFISTVQVLLDFRAGGKGFAVGKVSEKDAFECDMNAEFKKNLKVDGTLEANVAYTADECTDYASDDPKIACTPAAVKKAVGLFQPGEHSHSNYAVLGSPNNLLDHGNEFNFISSAFNKDVYINWRTASGNKDGAVKSYGFYDGSGKLTKIKASDFVNSDGASMVASGSYTVLLEQTALSNNASVTFTGGDYGALIVYSWTWDGYVSFVVTPEILGTKMGMCFNNYYYAFTLSKEESTYTLTRVGSDQVSYIVVGVL